MGHSLIKLTKKELPDKAIFNSRFVVEVCEKVHVHYRNLRILLSMVDFLELAKGLVVAMERWDKLGQPEPKKDQHIELCRRKVATEPYNEGVQVNLNLNLYNDNKDKIYAEGAEFSDEKYIHVKWRDLRIECSIKEFEEFADAVAEAKRELESSNISSSVSPA
jgi:hypothetical protein